MSLDAFTNPPSDPASIAANRSGQGAPGIASAGLLQALAQANDFTMEDLQANRQGWMSPRQRSGVVRRTIGCLFLMLISTVGIVNAGGVGMVLAIGGPEALDGFSELVLLLVGLALAVLLALIPINMASKQLRDGRVAFVDGFVERERKETSDSETGSTTTSYSYVVNQQQQYAVNQQHFSVNGAAFHALVPGLRYRVYYLPSDHHLVSIEPLP